VGTEAVRGMRWKGARERMKRKLKPKTMLLTSVSERSVQRLAASLALSALSWTDRSALEERARVMLEHLRKVH
jgi:hypothetical protein